MMEMRILFEDMAKLFHRNHSSARRVSVAAAGHLKNVLRLVLRLILRYFIGKFKEGALLEGNNIGRWFWDTFIPSN